MRDRARLSHCLQLLQTAENIAELHQAIFHIRDFYDLLHLVFHLVRLGDRPGEHPLFLLTYPTEWVDLYVKRNYFVIDPVVELNRSGFLPVDWSCLDHTSAKTIGFFKEADSYGIGRRGVTIPVRGPRGERSLFTATSNLAEPEWSELRQDCMGDLQILSHYVHDRALSLSGLRDDRSYRELSQREKQCLELLARGLMPKQIGPVLQISESAVRLYLRSTKQKLRVATTAQAIAKAATLEMIHG